MNHERRIEQEDQPEQNRVSRRKALGGLGVALASAIVAPALGSPKGQQGEDLPTPELYNPVDKYPKPPFQTGMQPFPPALVSVPTYRNGGIKRNFKPV